MATKKEDLLRLLMLVAVDMYGVGGGGVFGTQNTKVTCTLLYYKGGVSIFLSRITKV